MAASPSAYVAARWTIALLVACLLFLAGVLALSQFSASQTRTEVSAHRAAHVVATNFEWVFEASSQALRRIDDAVTNRLPGAVTIGDLNEAARDLPKGYQYSVYDADGRLRFSSLPQPWAITVADRDYFVRVKAGEEFVISPQVTERMTGIKVFIVARRLERDGVFVGAASVAIPQTALRDLSLSMGEPGEINVSLIGLDGMLIAREPPIEPINLKGGALFEALAQAPHGTYQTVSPADGVERIVGYWQLRNWPVIAVSGIAKKTAFRDFWRHAASAAALTVPLVILGGLMIRRIAKLMARDAERTEELAAAIDRQTYLLREIHHRVKNNLQTVMSLIRLERLPPDTKQSLQTRIIAMMNVHEEMYQSDHYDRVNLRSYLTKVVEGIAASHRAPVHVDLDIASVEVTGDRALQVGILTNELVSNAYKHAFGPRQGGHLIVHLTETGPGQLRLLVRDDGPGYDGATRPQNMGSRLIEAYAAQLGGAMTLTSEGYVEAVIDFPTVYSAAPSETVAPAA